MEHPIKKLTFHGCAYTVPVPVLLPYVSSSSPVRTAYATRTRTRTKTILLLERAPNTECVNCLEMSLNFPRCYPL